MTELPCSSLTLTWIEIPCRVLVSGLGLNWEEGERGAVNFIVNNSLPPVKYYLKQSLQLGECGKCWGLDFFLAAVLNWAEKKYQTGKNFQSEKFGKSQK